MGLNRLSYLAIVLLASIFFIPLLGGVHLFDWDEINFAEASREMLVLGDFFRVHIDFQPFWEKPPFFFWLQAVSMKIFGVNEFAARFPNAIAGILSLCFIFHIGKFLKGNRFGWLWVSAYFGSILPFLYFKSGIIDPWFNLFIFAGIYYFIRFYWTRSAQFGSSKTDYRFLIISGLSIGFAMLTKGPVGLLIPGLAMIVYWIMSRFKWYVSILDFVWLILLSLLIIGLWLGTETAINGPWFVTEFITYQYRLFSTEDAGHGGFPGYHFVVLLIGVFPASIFAIRAMFKDKLERGDKEKNFKLWMLILFWVVLILFTIVKSKIVHYSSMCYFPMTFLAAWTIHDILEGKVKFAGWMKALILSIGGIYALATIALPFLGRNIEMLKPLFAKDKFALANLDAEVNWQAIDAFPGLFLLITLGFFLFQTRLNKHFKAIAGLFAGIPVFVFLVLIFDINNIEAYSQRAAIEFYQSKQGEDCYINTHGFKSYAHLYYFKKQPVDNQNSYEKDWLLNGVIDKPVYFVTKINKTKGLEEHPELKELYRKNGFVFYKREPPK
jgi:4-amino-4-deoxy-L-arabinose transferase-like glycosyltransferase